MRIVKLLPHKKEKCEDILSRFDPYIITQVQHLRNCSSLATHPAVLDLEIDDLIQRVRIKLWQALAKTEIRYPYAYIKRIIRNEIVDMARLHKPLVPLPSEEEWNEHEVKISLEQPGSDPAEEVEQQLDALAYLNQTIQAILKLPPRQRLAMICSLKDRVDDRAQLINAFKRYRVDIEFIRWPTDKEEKQVVQASLAHARKALAKVLRK